MNVIRFGEKVLSLFSANWFVSLHLCGVCMNRIVAFSLSRSDTVALRSSAYTHKHMHIYTHIHMHTHTQHWCTNIRVRCIAIKCTFLIILFVSCLFSILYFCILWVFAERHCRWQIGICNGKCIVCWLNYNNCSTKCWITVIMLCGRRADRIGRPVVREMDVPRRCRLKGLLRDHRVVFKLSDRPSAGTFTTLQDSKVALIYGQNISFEKPFDRTKALMVWMILFVAFFKTASSSSSSSLSSSQAISLMEKE